MPEEITPPVEPNEPKVTKPPLTPTMQAIDKMTGTSPPGAGGWTPSMATVYAIGGIGTTFGAAGPVLKDAVPGTLGVALAGLCGAIAAGLIFFAMKSAGPRKPTND